MDNLLRTGGPIFIPLQRCQVEALHGVLVRVSEAKGAGPEALAEGAEAVPGPVAEADVEIGSRQQGAERSWKSSDYILRDRVSVSHGSKLRLLAMRNHSRVFPETVVRKPSRNFDRKEMAFLQQMVLGGTHVLPTQLAQKSTPSSQNMKSGRSGMLSVTSGPSGMLSTRSGPSGMLPLSSAVSRAFSTLSMPLAWLEQESAFQMMQADVKAWMVAERLHAMLATGIQIRYACDCDLVMQVARSRSLYPIVLFQFDGTPRLEHG